MIVESMTVEGLYVISLALSATEKWKAAGSSLSTGSKTEGWLTVLAVVALIISEILLFWVFTKYRRSEQQLNQKITDLTVVNVKMRQEKDKSNAANEKLKQEVAELTTTNEKLRQESAQLTRSV
jgi:C4-dicarboxylate-specific signal transduction histidine kinase